MRALVPLMAAFALVFASASPVGAAPCQFVLGFKVLHDLMPNAIGDCLVDEHHNPANGDGLQETTGDGGGLHTGLLVWRKADNWTAYTDGNQTWINGPFGLESRFNVQVFKWEPHALYAPQVIPESPTESAICAALPRNAQAGGLGVACMNILFYNYAISHPAPTAVPIAPAPKPIFVPAPAYVPSPSYVPIPASGSLESVGVVKVDDLNSHAFVTRRDGSTWYLEYGVGCINLGLYEERAVFISSPGGFFAGIGSKLVLPDDGEVCPIWSSTQIQ